MAQAERTLWLGRVRVRDGELVVERTVRVWTDGEAPAAGDVAHEIPDPFEAAAVHRGASPDADVVALARDLPGSERGIAAPVEALELAPPVRPGKIVCVGRNYAAHAAELGNEVPAEPLLFQKPSSSLVACGDPIALPSGFVRIDMEAELVVVIGRRGRRLAPSRALEHVAGYTLGNDVSCRDLQRSDKQWTRAKGFDTFAPLGPWIRVTGSATPPAEARIVGSLDGEVRQDAALGDMIFDVPTVLSYISEFITLEPGDVVYTGTPEGVSPLAPGQRVEVRLEGWSLGRLINPVRPSQ